MDADLAALNGEDDERNDERKYGREEQVEAIGDEEVEKKKSTRRRLKKTY